MMQTDFAVYVGIVYAYLPFMILPALREACAAWTTRSWKPRRTWGAARSRRSSPSPCPSRSPASWPVPLLVFIPAVGEFVIPALLGGPDTLMIGRVLWDEFFANRDWPVASAVAIAALVLLVIPITVFQRLRANQEGA